MHHTIDRMSKEDRAVFLLLGDAYGDKRDRKINASVAHAVAGRGK